MITKKVYAVIKSVPMEVVELELYYDPTTPYDKFMMPFFWTRTEDTRLRDMKVYPYMIHSKITEENLLSIVHESFYEVESVSLVDLNNAIKDMAYLFYKQRIKHVTSRIDEIDEKKAILQMERDQLSKYVDKVFAQMKEINPKLESAFCTTLKFDANGHPYTQTAEVTMNDIEDAEFRIKRGI